MRLSLTINKLIIDGWMHLKLPQICIYCSLTSGIIFSFSIFVLNFFFSFSEIIKSDWIFHFLELSMQFASFVQLHTESHPTCKHVASQSFYEKCLRYGRCFLAIEFSNFSTAVISRNNLLQHNPKNAETIFLWSKCLKWIR